MIADMDTNPQTPISDKEIEKASVEHTLATNPRCIGGSAFEDMMYTYNIDHNFIAGAKWYRDELERRKNASVK